MSRVREVSTIAATWIGICSALYGGHAAYTTYRDNAAKQVDDRSMTALGYVTQFQSAHMMGLRDKLYGFIFCRGADCAAKAPSNSEFFAFVEFFDTVAYCADRKLCDRVVVKDVFGPYATWHWPCLASEINRTRNGEQELQLSRPFGHGLETLKLKDVGTGHCGNLREAAGP